MGRSDPSSGNSNVNEVELSRTLGCHSTTALDSARTGLRDLPMPPRSEASSSSGSTKVSLPSGSAASGSSDVTKIASPLRSVVSSSSEATGIPPPLTSIASGGSKTINISPPSTVGNDSSSPSHRAQSSSSLPIEPPRSPRLAQIPKLKFAAAKLIRSRPPRSPRSRPCAVRSLLNLSPSSSLSVSSRNPKTIFLRESGKDIPYNAYKRIVLQYGVADLSINDIASNIAEATHMELTPILEDVVREVVLMSGVYHAREKWRKSQEDKTLPKETAAFPKTALEQIGIARKNVFEEDVKSRSPDRMDWATTSVSDDLSSSQERYRESRAKKKGGDPMLKGKRRTRRRRQPSYVSEYERKRKRLEWGNLVPSENSSERNLPEKIPSLRNHSNDDLQAPSSEDDKFYTPSERKRSASVDAEIEAVIRRLKATLPGSFPSSPIEAQAPESLPLVQPKLFVFDRMVPVSDRSVLVSNRKLKELQKALSYAEARTLMPNKDRGHWITEVRRLQGEIRTWEKAYNRGKKIWTKVRYPEDKDVQVPFQQPPPPLSPQSISPHPGQHKLDPLLETGPLIRKYEQLGGWNENGLMTLDVLTLYARAQCNEISSKEFVRLVSSLLEGWLRIWRGHSAVKSLMRWRQHYQETGGASDLPKDDFDTPICNVRENSCVLLRLELDPSWVPVFEKDYDKYAADRLQRDNEELILLARRLGLSTTQFVQLRDFMFKQILWDVRHGNRIAASWRDDVKPKAPSSKLRTMFPETATQQKWQDKWRKRKGGLYEHWERDMDETARNRTEAYAEKREQKREEFNVETPEKRENDRQREREKFENELRTLKRIHLELDRKEGSEIKSQRSQEDSNRRQQRELEDAEVEENIGKAEAIIVEKFREVRHAYDNKSDALRDCWRQEFTLSNSLENQEQKSELQSKILDLESDLSRVAEKERQHREELIRLAHAHLSQRLAEDQSVMASRRFEDARRNAIKATRNWSLEKRKREFDEQERFQREGDEKLLVGRTRKHEMGLTARKPKREGSNSSIFKLMNILPVPTESAPNRTGEMSQIAHEDKVTWIEIETAEREKFSIYRNWLLSEWLPKTRQLLRKLWEEEGQDRVATGKADRACKDQNQIDAPSEGLGLGIYIPPPSNHPLDYEIQVEIAEARRNSHGKNAEMRFNDLFESAWKLVTQQIPEQWNALAEYHQKRLIHADVAMNFYRFIERGERVEQARQGLADEYQAWHWAMEKAAEAWSAIGEMVGQVDDAVAEMGKTVGKEREKAEMR